MGPQPPYWTRAGGVPRPWSASEKGWRSDTPLGELPAGAWLVDPGAAEVSFYGRAARWAPMMRARFGQVTGRIDVDAADGRVEVDVLVDVAAMTSGNPVWDRLLRALDPLDTARHPRARFRSTAVHPGSPAALVEGLLTLRGQTRAVTLDVVHRLHPRTGSPLVRATGVLDRAEFDIRCEIPGLTALVPRRMTVQIAVATVRG